MADDDEAPQDYYRWDLTGPFDLEPLLRELQGMAVPGYRVASVYRENKEYPGARVFGFHVSLVL
eukprot:2924558-Lingulodinium_polyedra.AAC.1